MFSHSSCITDTLSICLFEAPTTGFCHSCRLSRIHLPFSISSLLFIFIDRQHYTLLFDTIRSWKMRIVIILAFYLMLWDSMNVMLHIWVIITQLPSLCIHGLWNGSNGLGCEECVGLCLCEWSRYVGTAHYCWCSLCFE